MSERIVLIGSSHSGLSVIETLRREGFQGTLSLISEEQIPIYSPTALPYLLGKKDRRSRVLRPPEFYQGLRVVEGKAVSIDPKRSKVFLQNGKSIHYDRLVLATGASPVRPSIPVSDGIPLLTLRRIEDLHQIEKRAGKSQRIVILGAGLIGLHLAQIFSEQKREVHVIELREQILPGLIHRELALFLKGLLERKGIQIHLGTSLSDIRRKEAFLSNGEKIRTDLVVAAAGIQPNLDLVRETALTTRDGIVVNERMETSLPGISACGDVAEFRDFFTGENRLNPNVISAAEQGRIVAEGLLGKKTVHPGLISINTFNCLGLILFTLGRTHPDRGDRIVEENEIEKGVFKRFIFHGETLKGMALCNTPVDGGLYYRLIRERISLKGLERRLVRDPFLWGKWIGRKVFKE